MPPIVLILISVGLSVLGQLLLKAGVTRLGRLNLGRSSSAISALRLASNPLIWTGLVVYGLGTFFWLAALSRVELSYAYPFLSLSYVLILLAAWVVLREHVSVTRLLGVMVVCFGVYAVAAG
jgi:drug/metabolite transporter (DMT)-like permease